MGNIKAPFKIDNPSRSFVLSKDKSKLTLSSHKTHKFNRSKQMGIETRLYYEYKNTERLGGQTFFFTLTYNDKSIPVLEYKSLDKGIERFPSFDYFDLVELLNGAFKKKLLRKYGTNFKYFVSCELGDGAGKRGVGNNPHYHCLFFLRPDTSKNAKPYVVIDPLEFRSMLRLYWQGFDEDIDARNGVFHHYKTAKKGIVKEGKYGIAVNSFRACVYVAKYVTKSFEYVKRENRIKSLLYENFRQSIKYDDLSLKQKFLDGHYPDWKNGENSFLNHQTMFDVDLVIDNLGCRDDYHRWIDNLIESKVDVQLAEYRNRYGCKYRISNGVGEYALDFIDDSKDNLLIPVTTSKGVQYRPLNLYYYRKLFTEIVQDNDGRPIRVLNQKGIDFKASQIQRRVDRLACEMKSKVQVLDKSLYQRILDSSVYDSSVYSISMSYDSFKACYQGLKDNDDLFECYAKYKLVYEGRFCPFVFNEYNRLTEFPVINLVEDYRRFLRPSIFDGYFNPMSASYELSVDYKDYISYNGHPYFHKYLCFFAVFDLLADYLFVSTDTKKEDDWKQLDKVRSFHSALNISNLYR